MVIFNGDGFLEEVFCRIFGTVLMKFPSDSFTAHLGLPFFLSRCILLTGLSLILACTSPRILALRLDSPDWQLQWWDTGGTVTSLGQIFTDELAAFPLLVPVLHHQMYLLLVFYNLRPFLSCSVAFVIIHAFLGVYLRVSTEQQQ